MKIGYGRISITDENHDLQTDALKAAGQTREITARPYRLHAMAE